MENTFTTFGKQLLFGCIGLIAGVFMATGVQYVLAWTGPTAAPPSNNVAAPINVSATAQTKAGSFTAAGIASTDGLTTGNAGGAYSYVTMKDDESSNGVKYIHANSNVIGFLNGVGNWEAYWDSAGNSWQAGNMNAAGVTYAQQYVDSNDGNYYVDPNGVSRFNDIRPNIMYDGQNTGYYVDPNGGSNLNGLNVSSNIGTGGYIDTHDVWLRSVGKWASTVANQPSCNFGGQVGVICGGRSDYWSVFYTCTNGVITDISLAWTGC